MLYFCAGRSLVYSSQPRCPARVKDATPLSSGATVQILTFCVSTLSGPACKIKNRGIEDTLHLGDEKCFSFEREKKQRETQTEGKSHWEEDDEMRKCSEGTIYTRKVNPNMRVLFFSGFVFHHFLVPMLDVFQAAQLVKSDRLGILERLKRCNEKRSCN